MAEAPFFPLSRMVTAAGIADLTGAKLVTPELGLAEINGVASLAESSGGKLVYVDGRKNAPLLNGINATAVLCSEDVAAQVPAGIAVLVTSKPLLAFAQVSRLLFPTAFFPQPMLGEAGVSSAAIVASSAKIEHGAIIEAGAVIGANAAIGTGTIVSPTAVIGAGCQIGRNSYIGPGVTVVNALVGDKVLLHAGVRIGQAGFGYVGGRTGPEPTPQIGKVVIQELVEIGANTTVDRGGLSDTVIGASTKIDNLVQIAHNVKIGRGCIIAGQCGLSGSVTLGDFVMLGGRVGIADHVNIGSGAQVAAGSGIMTDVPPGERWGGLPAQPIRNFFREMAAIRRLSKGPESKGDDNE